MSEFTQYTNGIQNISPIAQTGAAIGQMYQKGIGSFGADIAEGIKQYQKNGQMSDEADATHQGLATKALQTLQMIKDNPDMKPMYDSLHQELLDHQDFGKQSLGGKLGMNASLQAHLNSFNDYFKQQQAVNEDVNFNKSAPVRAAAAQSTLEAYSKQAEGFPNSDSIKKDLDFHAGLLKDFGSKPMAEQKAILQLTEGKINSFGQNLQLSKATADLSQNQTNLDNQLKVHQNIYDAYLKSLPKGNNNYDPARQGIAEFQNQIKNAKTPQEKQAILNASQQYISAYPTILDKLSSGEANNVNSSIQKLLNNPEVQNTTANLPVGINTPSFSPKKDTPQEYFDNIKNFINKVEPALKNAGGSINDKNQLFHTIVQSNIQSLEKNGLDQKQLLQFEQAYNAYNRTQDHYANGEEQEPKDESLLNNPINTSLSEGAAKSIKQMKEEDLPESNVVIPPHVYNMGNKPQQVPRSQSDQWRMIQEGLKKEYGEVPNTAYGIWNAMHPQNTANYMQAPNGTTMYFNPAKGSFEVVPNQNPNMQNEWSNNQFYEKDSKGMPIIDENGQKTAEHLGGKNSPYYVQGSFTGKNSEEARFNLNGLADATSSIDRLVQIASMPDAKYNRELMAEARVLATRLQAATRNAYFPSGRVAEWEQKILEGIAADPTNLFSLQSSNIKSLSTLKNDLENHLMEYNKGNGLTVTKKDYPSEHKEVSDIVKEMRLAKAKENLNQNPVSTKRTQRVF